LIKKYRVYGKVVGSIYLGEFKAENTEEAEMLAIENSDISFCHQCSSHCEDAQIEDIYIEEVQ
jgi:hypothetical protein